jgi:SAM-dependent methyltransferase
VHRLLFRSAIFLGSFLLFLSEPIAAKQLLPIFGGSAAVWMTCLVFFQAALLLGYLYAHILKSPKLHIAMLLLAAFCASAWSTNLIHPRQAGTHPAASIFASLTLTLGLPFLVLASTSPLLQVWLAQREQNTIPYRLFALSNLASLLALLAYPTLIEPFLSLSRQRSLWSAGVTIFALITAVIAWQTPFGLSSRSEAKGSASSSPNRTRLLWFLLPMAASMQLSAVTAHLTSNIAAIPLLWILPLAVYLLTFILAFQFPGILRYRGILLRLLAVMLASLGYILAHTDVSLPIGIAILFFLVESFLACLFCHAEAYALRPETAAATTLFYLTIAAGSATGSFLIGIAAPLVFAGNYDIAITFFITAALALTVTWESGWAQRILWATGSALLLFLVFAIHTAYLRQTLLATRNFYGSLRVQQSVTDHGDPIRTLLNGSIQHGTQIFSDDLRHVPTTYYAPDSGIGLAMAGCCPGRARNVGVVGLGAGTLAAYGKPGDTFRFYEINPAVLPIAQNLFTYLRDSHAKLSFVEGDARASLASEPAQHFDILVVDAFSGDAIPLHLLTLEAMAIYRRHLAPGGIIAFHVSNQYVDLIQPVDLLAHASHMQSRVVVSAEDTQSGAFRSIWILVTDNQAFLAQPDIALHATLPPPNPLWKAWTDDYSFLLPFIR